MFGCLFEDEEEVSLSDHGKTGSSKFKTADSKLKNSPSLPRGQTRLCGLQNQGATCYLNSLLQTLFFTPEFRGGLFALRPEDLGDLASSGTNSKIRVIPLQLQKLFAQLLLLDQDSINTADLTSSFGWTGNEGFQQHDVQELNRILFSAIESSLVGTPGEVNLIKTLYHGTSVTKVICQQCGKVSEREEDYLDLPLILSGCSGLEQSLSMSYVAMEILEGANQYKCEACGKHVVALKGSKIRTLPSILTFSLLRFDYNIQRGERFKETKRYTFPTSLSMKEFCESVAGTQEDQEYELFSVVIHSGSCYGGHYHAYICDVERLGTWIPPEKEQVRVVHKDEEGQEEAVHCDNPVDLMVTLLNKLGGVGSVNQLCQCLSKETGMSWNKRFKSQYGPLTKFFKKHSDVFKFSDCSGWVSLQPIGAHDNTRYHTRDNSRDHTRDNSRDNASRSEAQKHVDPRESSSHGSKTHGQSGSCSSNEDHVVEEESSKPKRHWFDVNDSRISCIREEDLQSQFSGKESAYMLFYRRKNLPIPKENPSFSIPSGLQHEVEEMNKELTRKREDYDRLLNEISVCVHFGDHYTVKDGALELKQGLSTDPLVVSLDRRKTIKDLLQTITKLDSARNQDMSSFSLHIARQLPAGLHLFEELSIQSESSLLQSGIHEGTEVFLWNGKEVDGCTVYAGEESAPVLLNITYSLSNNKESFEIQKAFRKNTTVGEMKLIVCSLIGIPDQDLLLSWMKSQGKSTEVVLFRPDQDGNTLEELNLKDGDRLVAEGKIGTATRGVHSIATQESEKHANLMSFVVENRCLEAESDTQGEKQENLCWSVFPVEILKDQTIGELKAHILSRADYKDVPDRADVYRLRVDDDVQGLGPPLYEYETVSSSCLKQGDKLVLEPGAPLLPSQIMIRYYICCPNHTREEMELVVDKTSTVGQCLQLLVETANLEGMQWHLRKANWFGEPANTLDNEDETLASENITNGDMVIIEEGRLPPKGFVRLSLWQTKSDPAKDLDSQGYVTWITSGIQGLLGSSSTETSKKKDEVCDALSFVGDVEISLDASLYDLKLQISTLVQLSDHVIPTPGFIRLQEAVNGHPTRILRGMKRTLRQLKLTSSTHVAMQILQHEEDLSPSAFLLKLRRRIPGQRSYDTEQEVIFEPSDGATPYSLLQFIAKVCDIPRGRLAVAKYFRGKYDWLVVKDTPKPQGKRKGGKKKNNLRQSPYYLQDGDILGIKDCQYDPENKDDFSTPTDDQGKARLKQEQEELKQRKREKRSKTRRPETPLRIHVDDFR